jgi:hypothetical protein
MLGMSGSVRTWMRSTDPRESSADATQHVGDRRGLLPGLVAAVLELRLPEEVADEALPVCRTIASIASLVPGSSAGPRSFRSSA